MDAFEPIEFSNKDNVTIDAGSGDDVINLNNQGPNPTGAHAGRAQDHHRQRRRPAGTVINDDAPQPNVNFTGIERLTLVVQQTDGDGVRLDGTAGNDAIEFFHGLTSDSGSVVGTMDQNNATGSGPFTMTPMNYTGASPLANDFDVNFFNPGGTDSFVFNGTADNDTIAVAGGEAGGTEFSDTLNGIVVSRVEVFNIASALVRGLDGNDALSVNVPAGPAATTLLFEGGAGTNVLNYTAFANAATTIDLGASSITVPGNNPVTFAGIATINENSSGPGSTLTINGTTAADSLTYTPTGTTAGTVTANGQPTINFSAVASTFTLDPAGGVDAVSVNGTATNDTINVFRSGTNTGVQVAALKAVTLPSPNTEALQVLGGLGDDQFNVNVGAAIGSDVISIPLTFDGGPGSDLLDVFGAPATAVDQVIATVGPAAGQGRMLYQDAAAVLLMTIDYVNLEPVADLVAATTLTINGTDAANAITYSNAQIIGAGGRVAVDNFEAIEFSNKTNLVINGLGGADTITISNTTTPPGLTGITVDGGNSSDDKIILQGTAAAETFEYQPTGATSGTLLYSLGVPAATPLPNVNFSNVEAVQIDGGSDSNGSADALFFTTVGGADTVVLTPGPTFDSGTLQQKATAAPTSTPPLTFSRLGTTAVVTLQDAFASRFDTLEYQGTNVSDVFQVAATGQVKLNSQVLVDPTGVTALILEGLAGNDTFNVAGGSPFATLNIDGGSSTADAVSLTGTLAASDSVTIAPDATNSAFQDITGLGPFITTAGVETIGYTGVGGNDTLTVNTGAQDNTIRVSGGNAVPGIPDRVTSDSLPVIQYLGLSTFILDPGAGTDTATFATTGLSGALVGNYRYNAGPTDTLVIEGTGGNDTFTVTHPSVALPVAVTQANSVVAGVTVAALSGPARVQINTLAGNDQVTVDVGSTDLVSVPISYDGGTGSDRLTVSGTPASGVGNVTYTAGPQLGSGLLLYQDAGGGTLMTIDFANLEPVTELTPATTLTVNGTAANNVFAVAKGSVAANGLVTVDQQESIEFSNKTNLILNGLAGSDTFTLARTSIPTGLTGITVNGGGDVSDAVIVNGLATFDAFIVTATQVTDSSSPVAITYQGVQQLTVNGGNSGNTFFVQGTPAGVGVVVNTGNGTNSITVGDTGNTLAGIQGALTFNGQLGNNNLALNDQGTATGQTFTLAAGSVTRSGAAAITFANVATVTANGGTGGDFFTVTPTTSVTFTVNAGLPNVPPGDFLNVPLAGTANALLSKTTVAPFSGSWTFGNAAPIIFTGIETFLTTPLPTVQFNAASESVAENAGTFSIPVTLTGPTGMDTTIPFTLAGTGVTGVTASPLVIPAGQTSATISGTIVADGLVIPDRTVTLTLGSPTNATLSTPAINTLTIVETEVASITSPASATFTVGTAGAFQVTAPSLPNATFSEAGALPSGVTFSSAGLLSGTPAAGTAGKYPLTITASNGSGTATQGFTLTVNQAPAITSPNNATFVVGAPNTFTVTVTGFPAPTLSVSGTLPGGVTFNSSTGVLSGVPAAGSAGTDPLTFTVANGVAGDATQSFTLTVQEPPAPPPSPLPPSPFKVFVDPAFTGAPGTHPASNPALTIGVDAFPTIQQALDAVPPTGTVAAATYKENLHLAKAVTLLGAGSATTILAGANVGAGLDITGGGIAISGLTVRGFAVGIVTGTTTLFLSLTDVPITGNQFGGAITNVGTVLIVGGPSNDTFYVTPTALAQAGGNSISYSDVSFLTIDGGGGDTNGLQVFLNDTNQPDTVWVVSFAVTRDTNFFQLIYRDTGGALGGGVAVVLGDGPELAVVLSQFPGVPISIFGGAGNDTINVGVTAGSGYQNLTIDGGGGVNTLGVYDLSGGGIARRVTLADGSDEIDMSYGGSILSRIRDLDIQAVLSNVLAS